MWGVSTKVTSAPIVRIHDYQDPLLQLVLQTWRGDLPAVKEAVKHLGTFVHLPPFSLFFFSFRTTICRHGFASPTFGIPLAPRSSDVKKARLWRTTMYSVVGDIQALGPFIRADKHLHACPVFVAAARDHAHLVRYFAAECQLPLEEPDLDGWVPLHAAAASGWVGARERGK